MDWRMLGLAAAALLAGCTAEPEDPFAGIEGGRPADLDLSARPTGLILLGPDEVRLRQGESLATTVDGDSAVTDALRFAIHEGRLAVLRQPGSGGRAVINVTMPAPASLVAAGSGRSAFASDGPVTAAIAGSGEVRVRGRARCEARSTGSGKLVCEPEAPAS